MKKLARRGFETYPPSAALVDQSGGVCGRCVQKVCGRCARVCVERILRTTLGPQGGEMTIACKRLCTRKRASEYTRALSECMKDREDERIKQSNLLGLPRELCFTPDSSSGLSTATGLSINLPTGPRLKPSHKDKIHCRCTQPQFHPTPQHPPPHPKLLPVNRLAAGPVALGEVSPLDHELRDDPV